MSRSAQKMLDLRKNGFIESNGGQWSFKMEVNGATEHD